MAIYHLCIKIISRGKGKSVVSSGTVKIYAQISLHPLIK